MSQKDDESGGRYGRLPVALAGAGGVFGLLLLGLWTQRAPIAQNFIARELGAMDVRARYDLASIGVRTHRIENIVLGDPAHPDLTAKWVEVDLTLSGLTPGVAAVRAGGVRLYGRFRDGALSLGELDKFRDPKSTAPFSLPDLAVALDDARMRLDTDMGPVGMKLEGHGNLQDGFAGKLAAVMPRASIGPCGLERATAFVDLSMTDGQPRIMGPVRAAAMRCPGSAVALSRPVLAVDATLGPALDRWTGQASLSGDSLAAQGIRLERPSIRTLFDGNAGRTRGQFRLVSDRVSGLGLGVDGSAADGEWTLGSDRGKSFARLQGTLSAHGIRPSSQDPLAALRRSTRSTPVGPLAAKLADALRDAGADNSLRATYAYAQHGKGSAVVVTAARFDARSGARVGLGEGGRFTLSSPALRWTLDGSMTMEGGGLPRAALRLAPQPGGGLGGQLFVDDYAAPGAKLRTEPVRFTAARNGDTRFSTALELDGPLGDGRVRGLHLPVEGVFGQGGRVRFNPNCTEARIVGLAYAGLELDRTALDICPAPGGALLAFGPSGVSGGGEVRGPLLQGRIGRSPLRLSAVSVGFTLTDPGFSAREVELRVGPADSPVRLATATLTGAMHGDGLAGHLSGASGKIGAVPLLMSDASGDWSFAGGALRVTGGLLLSDAERPDRFNPLPSRDFTLTLKDNRIAATGSLVTPKGGATVMLADIRHDLGSGRGRADIRVPGITFDGSLQPEDISRLALGVVANARGLVTGSGQVRWNGGAVTSEGSFATGGMDLAAAFGPVTGLSGTITFTDLVNLVTAPGQEVRLASVNPGIEATNGIVRYRLVAGQKVHIEGGEWPFSGGELKLLPTTLDFSADAERYLTFRVIGLDAGAFIQKLELENVSATGTFDGIMPLIFNAQGGRIAGGVLVARQQGMPPLLMPEGVLPTIPCDPARQSGTLSYVGPVSNEQVGVMGKIAFDALKNLQYKCLTILMDGSLDGEVVTNVVFNGVNRGKLGDAPESIARNFIGLPFLFNIRIQAPFRGLLGTARSFVDPSGLVRDRIGEDYQRKLAEGVAVQPAESDTVQSGDDK